jgi:hypothetical protein
MVCPQLLMVGFSTIIIFRVIYQTVLDGSAREKEKKMQGEVTDFTLLNPSLHEVEPKPT